MSAKTRIKPARERARARRRAVLRKKRLRTWGTVSIVVLFGVLAAGFLLGRGKPQPGTAVAGATRARVSVGPGSIEVGRPFPGFSVTAVDGRVVSGSSLGGKPTIIWFTTSYCLPCQAGARQVAQLDDQLGGNAFNVLVMFVDPKEAPAALTSWREQFGRPDWSVALDQNDTFASAVGLRYLDTKLLLGPDGTLENVNLNPVDPDYLGLLQKAVRGA